MSVRISGGSAKGRKLLTSKRSGLRPTSGRVRGAIFSIIGVVAVEGRRVLDLYAGTGALGLEAISRGAEWVDFVESNQKQCYLLRSSIRETGFQGKAHVHQAKVEKFLDEAQGEYDLVLMDPPYQMPGLEDILVKMGNSTMLKDEGVLVIEHSSRQSFQERYGRMGLVKSRRYGDTAVSIYAVGGSNG